MSTEKDTTNGPGQALAVLYQANDLLNMLRTAGEDAGKSEGLSPTAWTVTTVISERINQAITLIDAGTPHPADVEPVGNGEAAVRESYKEDPLDELTMTLSQAKNLALAINDVGMSGEKRDVVGLAVMTIREIERAYDIARDELFHSKYWRMRGAA